MNAMMRVRLKADGRLVEILADGSERAMARAAATAPLAGPDVAGATVLANPRIGGQGRDAVYAKGIRARAKLTQAEFAARIGVPIAAILMPAGFFLSVIGKNPAKPNRLIVLLWIGVASLTLGLLAAGIGMIIGAAQALAG